MESDDGSKLQFFPYHVPQALPFPVQPCLGEHDPVIVLLPEKADDAVEEQGLFPDDSCFFFTRLVYVSR